MELRSFVNTYMEFLQDNFKDHIAAGTTNIRSETLLTEEKGFNSSCESSQVEFFPRNFRYMIRVETSHRIDCVSLFTVIPFNPKDKLILLSNILVCWHKNSNH